MRIIPAPGDRIYHPDCGMGIVIYTDGSNVAALWERAEERREVPIARCGVGACNMCLGAADTDGVCMEGCDNTDDDRCVDCYMSACNNSGEECPCNYACHDDIAPDAAQGE